MTIIIIHTCRHMFRMQIANMYEINNNHYNHNHNMAYAIKINEYCLINKLETLLSTTGIHAI